MPDNGNGEKTREIAILKETDKLIFTKLDYLRETVDDINKSIKAFMAADGICDKNRRLVTRHDEKIKNIMTEQVVIRGFTVALILAIVGIAFKIFLGG